MAAIAVLSVASAAAAGRSEPAPVDARDALLAALGTATLECLGTVGPLQYVTDSGFLERAFDSCPTGDRLALSRIDELLGVQQSEPGERDDIAGHYVRRWEAFERRALSRRLTACPTWQRTQAIEAPTEESVSRYLGAGKVGKLNYRYRVDNPACHGNRRCNVASARICSAGFGPGFLLELDARTSTVVVDPTWWLLHNKFDPENNPFLTPGYYHGMSYYGSIPGAVYGAIERAGEACSAWDEDTHQHMYDRHLIPVDCGGGWFCMTYCGYGPPPDPS